MESILSKIALLIGLVIGITVHECAHAWSANELGDPTARYQVAQRHLQSVLDAVPEAMRGEFPLYSRALTYLGGIHAIAGQPERARSAFEEAARYDDQWAEPLQEFLQASAVLRKLFDDVGLQIPAAD